MKSTFVILSLIIISSLFPLNSVLAGDSLNISNVQTDTIVPEINTENLHQFVSTQIVGTVKDESGEPLIGATLL